MGGGTATHQITELKYPSHIIDHFRHLFCLYWITFSKPLVMRST